MNKVLILAGGKGSRMKKLNNIPKVFQLINDKPMLSYLIEKFRSIGFIDENINIVFNQETLEYAKNVFGEHKFGTILQEVSNGTGGAVRSAVTYNQFNDDDNILICNGDNPFISIETLQNISKNNQPTLSVMETDNPEGYGRVILKDGMIVDIIEEKDCTPEQRKIKLVNTSIYVVPFHILKDIITKIDTNNAQNEYYLTDIVKHYPFNPYYIQNIDECFNINTPEQLIQGKELA